MAVAGGSSYSLGPRCSPPRQRNRPRTSHRPPTAGAPRSASLWGDFLGAHLAARVLHEDVIQGWVRQGEFGDVEMRVVEGKDDLLDQGRCILRINRDPAVHLLNLADRKSTRLNSSHQIISYAV